uniref:SAP domain-containing protein n=1 Tax=Nothobranchius pienaari TaxID=704102 RepID=A0A1A8MZX4_9TELE
MENTQSQRKLHVSICNAQRGESLKPCSKDDKYRCPLCSYAAEESYKVEMHIANTAMVLHNEFCIFKCCLPCARKPHFHCPYCLLTFARRDRFVSHLVSHTMTINLPSSCASAELPVEPPTAMNQAASTAWLIIQAAEINNQAAIAAQQFFQTATLTQLPTQTYTQTQLPVQAAATNSQAAKVAQLPIQTEAETQLLVQAATAVQLPHQPAATNSLAATEAQSPVQLKKASSRSKDIITCEICNLRLKKKNARLHLKRKHQENADPVASYHHLRSQCVDAKRGVFAVEKSFIGPPEPVHVIKYTSSLGHRLECELDRCNANAQFANRIGIQRFECEHIQSLPFCPCATELEGCLSESSLDVLVENFLFSQQRKDDLLKKQQEATKNDAPLSVLLTVGGTETTFHVSVFEPKTTFVSGRVIVTHDSKTSTWHCPCIDGKFSCTHKATAKWHLFEKMPKMFETAKIPKEDFTCDEAEDIGSITDDEAAERMIKYLISHKKIPAQLPETLVTSSRDAKALSGFPKHLIPSEAACTECGQHALGEPQLISATAKILTLSGIVTGISTYRKTCLNCDMVYRYQDWQDGVHNFDDHLLLSIHLCLLLRNALQTHTSVRRIIEIIELTERESFPNKDRILQAYLSFEGLTDHDYLYACDSCGYHPAVVVMGFHNEGVSSLPVSEIPNPPQNYNGEVNAHSFWEAVTMEVISHGLYPPSCRNPFVVESTYHNWSPWIGPQTRHSDILLNTESEKVCMPDLSGGVDQYLTKEQLADEVLSLKLSEIKNLCKKCGIDGRGSKMDLVRRLRDEMDSRAIYNQVFKKVRGASGGWAVITCPCGVVYSLKFNLRAERPSDFADLLLSWKIFPNITVYDNASGLVSHINERCPQDTPFAIHEGTLLDHTAENIRLAAEHNLKVNLPWLKRRKQPEDVGGHPVTGSVEHYCLRDNFHQSNNKQNSDILRHIEIVPELAETLSSQCAEQLFADMRKNNYFLNRLTLSAHMFLQRNIMHNYNVRKNTRAKEYI